MKKILNSLVMLLFIPVFSLFSQIKGKQFISVAVLDFESSQPRVEKMGSQVSLLLTSNLSLNDRIILVERQELSKILEEQQIGISGLINPDTAAKIGNLTGAKILITGRVFEIKNKTYITAKIIGTETSRVYVESINFPSDNPFDKEVKKLSSKIEKTILRKIDSLVAKVEPEENMIEKFKKIVRNKKLPTIAINIRETHFGRPAIDPAVETEIGLVLNKIGFEIIDTGKSNKVPDILITGEAFSEYGTQREGLFICKGRVEIKVIKKENGKTLTVDKQTEIGIDISENIAGKKALENAALALIERILPVILKSYGYNLR